MRLRPRVIFRVGTLGLALLLVACGNGSGSSDQAGEVGSDPPVSDAPIPAEPIPANAIPANATPGEMCDGAGFPSLAAYALHDGEPKWAVCSADLVRHSVRAATDEAVYLEVVSQPGNKRTTIAYDATDGTEMPSADPPPDDPTTSGGIEVEGIRIEGGQDDPTRRWSTSTGEVWTRPGSPPYDDVWAAGDGAVYVIDRVTDPARPRLVAYELASGETRWMREPVDPYGMEVGWPWHVRGEVLFTIWSNLALISTDDGSTLWRTDYPLVGFPRMTGVRANDDTVFVAFSSIRSGGD